MKKKDKITIYEKKFDEQVEKNEEIPLGDDDIKKYFPKAKILRYCDLKKYNNIEELLTHDKDYVFILYQESGYKGHWICISRYNNIIEFFCSYASQPDEPLQWVGKDTLLSLGIERPYITDMFNKTNMEVIYNPIKYQKEESDINTCGRHCAYRISNLIENNKNLDQHYDSLLKLKKILHCPFDTIVSAFVML